MGDERSSAGSEQMPGEGSSGPGAAGRASRARIFVHFGLPLLALGLIARVVEILDKQIVLESLLAVIPKFHDRNRKAFEIGYKYEEG